ncbi:MAG TPA: CpXC domain-containing protein [Ktedonobacterales bacterium]|nr:CpXC domain-containing protein [Ktedonobacterales bacterium]
MPRSSTMTYVCECGATFASTMYQTVNVTLEPQLLYRLLAGSLNVAVCPNCGRKIESEMPFIYHDMRRGLFAYAHPNAEASDEERDELLERLREVYDEAVDASERILAEERASQSTPPGQPGIPRLTVRRRSLAEDLSARLEPDTPPMQVIFGREQLVALVDSLLEPEERLGRLALSARGAGSAQRERIVSIAERLASQFDLQVETEGVGSDFTVWVYGSRERIEALAAQMQP